MEAYINGRGLANETTTSTRRIFYIASVVLFVLSALGVASTTKHGLSSHGGGLSSSMKMGLSKLGSADGGDENQQQSLDDAGMSLIDVSDLGKLSSATTKTIGGGRKKDSKAENKKTTTASYHVNRGNYKALNEIYQPVLDVPVVFIALKDSTSDMRKVRRTIETLAGETRIGFEDLAETVSVSQGINAQLWPKDIADAEYAVKDIRRIFHKKVKDGTAFASDVKDFHQLMGLLKHIDTRRADGALDDFAAGKSLTHHVGCLFAHLYQWQWVRDQGWPIAWIMESDGNKMTNVPFWAVQTLTENMPAEADVLFLQNFMREPGFEGPHFKSVGVTGPDGAYAKIDIYRMNHRASALSGLQSYVVTQKFIKKAQNFIATYGADMVDAFTAGNMCSYKDWWNQADLSKGEKPVLNCFQALARPIEVEGVKQTMVQG